MVEEIHRLYTELKFFGLGEVELLEERCVSAPVPWTAKVIDLLVAERAFARTRHGRCVEAVTIVRQGGAYIATDVRTIRAGVNVCAGVIAEVERQAALYRGGRIELPAANRPIKRTLDAAQILLAFAEWQFIDLSEDEGVLAIPTRRPVVEFR